MRRYRIQLSFFITANVILSFLLFSTSLLHLAGALGSSSNVPKGRRRINRIRTSPASSSSSLLNLKEQESTSIVGTNKNVLSSTSSSYHNQHRRLSKGKKATDDKHVTSPHNIFEGHHNDAIHHDIQNIINYMSMQVPTAPTMRTLIPTAKPIMTPSSPSSPVQDDDDVIILLVDGDMITSSDPPRQYEEVGLSLSQQYDGNLILYEGDGEPTDESFIWMSGFSDIFTDDDDGEEFYTRLNKKGNLVTRPGIFDDKKEPLNKVWESGSSGSVGRYYFVIDVDQTVVSIRKGSPDGPVVWSEKTTKNNDDNFPTPPSVKPDEPNGGDGPTTKSPSTPSSPSTPTLPSSPSTPTAPSSPSSPTSPSNPSSPTSPMSPISPSTPSSPTTPTSPTLPSSPSTPTSPSSPSTPTSPSSPSTPTSPSSPSTPSSPSSPSTPTSPSSPSPPTSPSSPSAPSAPSSPSDPTSPSSPTTPTSPSTPSSPSIPTSPSSPMMPTSPSIPSSPTPPSAPSTPTIPTLTSQPDILPTTATLPPASFPSSPTTPTVSSSPNASPSPPTNANTCTVDEETGLYGTESPNVYEINYFYAMETTSDVDNTTITDILNSVDNSIVSSTLPLIFGDDQCSVPSTGISTSTTRSIDPIIFNKNTRQRYRRRTLLQQSNVSTTVTSISRSRQRHRSLAEILGASSLPPDTVVESSECNGNNCFVIDGGLEIYTDSNNSNITELKATVLNGIESNMKNGYFNNIDDRIVNITYIGENNNATDNDDGSGDDAIINEKASEDNRVGPWWAWALLGLAMAFIVGGCLYRFCFRPTQSTTTTSDRFSSMPLAASESDLT